MRGTIIFIRPPVALAQLTHAYGFHATLIIGYWGHSLWLNLASWICALLFFDFQSVVVSLVNIELVISTLEGVGASLYR